MLNVLSIGGNALEGSKNLDSVLEAIFVLSKRGKLLITHGNGPQVGRLALEEKLPLALLTVQTQAEIGSMLESRIRQEFRRHGKSVNVSTILTRVLVDPKDGAFQSPSKPIGRFYTKAQAIRLGGNFTIRKLKHGYRRVVASPMPLGIVEKAQIARMLSKGSIVIAGGGGGIPVSRMGKALLFSEAVIDKDNTASLLARQLHASRLFTLTNVDGAYTSYGERGARLILKASVAQMERCIKNGEFEHGSMLPKVEAAIEFAKAGKGVAVIGNINKASKAVNLEGCTVING